MNSKMSFLVLIIVAIVILAFAAITAAIINLRTSDSYKLRIGEAFTYSAKTHPSVGYYFDAECDDEEAFTKKYSVKYNDSESVKAGMCGGDDGITTLTLIARKKGKFTVKIVHSFRGKVEKELTYKFSVR